MRSYKRADRVARLVQQALSSCILLQVRDVRVKDLVITHVRMTADMGIARVYVRLIEDHPSRRAKAMAGLEAVKSFLRQHIAQEVALLRVPILEFFYDEIPDEAARVEEILRKLEEERESSTV